MKKLLSVLILGLGILLSVVFVDSIKVNAGIIEDNLVKYAQFYDDANDLGFEINPKYIPAYGYNNFRFFSYDSYDGNTLVGTTEIHEMLLQSSITPTRYAFVYRVITTPLKEGSTINRSYNAGVKVSAQLPSNCTIVNWALENIPGNFSGTIGVGLSSSGPEISASVDFNHQELEVISRTNTINKKYETDFVVDIFWILTNYAMYSAKYYDMFIFDSPTPPNITVDYNLRYQAWYTTKYGIRDEIHIYEHPHNWNFTDYNSAQHTLFCAGCNYAKVDNHDYRAYNVGDLITHELRCKYCPYITTERHLKGANQKCKTCGFDANGPIILG